MFKKIAFVLKKLSLLLMFVYSARCLIASCSSYKLSKAGDVKIVGMFSVQRCFNGGKNNFKGIVRAEAMRYAINEFNARQNRTKFGYVMYDTYTTTEIDYTTNATTDMILVSSTTSSDVTCLCTDDNNFRLNTLGIVGPVGSSFSIFVQQLLLPYNIPIVSYSATSVELSDKVLYPNFFRTISSDSFQATMITDFLLKFNWTYVSLVASDNSYGRAGLDELNKQFLARNVCISMPITISETDDDANKYQNVLLNLTSQARAKVIVVWAYSAVVNKILSTAKNFNFSDVIWILSESTGRDPFLIELKRTYKGTIIVVVADPYVDENYRSYFFNLNYNTSNTWSKKVLKYYANDRNISLSTITYADIAELFDFGQVNAVQMAVKVFINAFINYKKFFYNQSSCELNVILNRDQFQKEIERVTFPILNNSKTFRFDDNHNPSISTYDLYLVNDVSFPKVASWSSEEGIQLTNNSALISEENFSRCSDDCPPGKFAVFNTRKPCCWVCELCPDEHAKKTRGQSLCNKCENFNDYFANSNKTECVKLTRKYLTLSANQPMVLTAFGFSLLGIVITIAIIIIFVLKKDTPMVRSSNFNLSMGQFVAHFVLFAVSVLLLGEETQWKCITTTYAGGCLIFSIITLTLVKVTHLVAVFGASHKLSKKDMFQIRFKEILIFLSLLLIYASTILVVQNISPLSIVEEPNLTQFTIYKRCKTNTFLIAHVTGLLVLLVLCGIQSFRGRYLPWKYNEAKYIAFALFSSTLVTVISIPIGINLMDPISYKLMLWFAMNLSNFLILIVLYGNKVTIIICRSEKNTTLVFRKKASSQVNGVTLSSFNRHFNLSIKESGKKELATK